MNTSDPNMRAILDSRSKKRIRAAKTAVELCKQNRLSHEMWHVIYLAIRACQTKSRGFVWEMWNDVKEIW